MTPTRRLSFIALCLAGAGMMIVTIAWGLAFLYGKVEHPLAEWLPHYVSSPSAPLWGLMTYFATGLGFICVIAGVALEIVIFSSRAISAPVFEARDSASALDEPNVAHFTIVPRRDAFPPLREIACGDRPVDADARVPPALLVAHLREQFSVGAGVLELPADASDKLIVNLVRFAVSNCHSPEFKVIVRRSS